MKKVILFFTFIFLSVYLFPDSAKDIFKNEMFSSFTEAVDSFVTDYSRISGIYNANGIVRGAASIGDFPSFKVGSNVGVIFFTNPLNFVKKVQFGQINWGSLENKIDSAGFGTYYNWFNSNFIPIPVSNYDFEIGAVKGISFSAKFHVGPFDSTIKNVMSVIPETKDYVKNVGEISFWGMGSGINYTFFKEYKYFPSISTSFVTDFSQISMGFSDIDLPLLYIDSDNPSVPSTLSFSSKTYVTSFSVDFTISKNFLFFQPFLSMKLTQSINHNITKFNVNIITTGLTSDAQTFFGNGKFEISNVSSIDAFGNELGKIIPSTEFSVSTGFEFVMSIFRLGVSGSYGVVSQKWLVSADMKFQVEKQHFDKLKKGKTTGEIK
jgi:hypothetical protein